MPTVETSRDPNPPILITIMDDALEPDVTVAPQGVVRVMVLNRGERVHGLVVARMDAPIDQLPQQDGHVRLDGLGVVGRVADVEPGGAGEAEVEFEPGTYALFANGAGDYARGLRVALTVQPAQGYEEQRHSEGPAGAH